MVDNHCEYDDGHHCIMCDAKIPEPDFIFGGRGNGKTMMIFYYNMRQACCSEECFNQLINAIKETDEWKNWTH